MLPINLTASQFGHYPPTAQKLALEYLGLLRQMPLAFLPSLLRELIEYDYKFPAERVRLDAELSCLAGLTTSQLRDWFSDFSRLHLSLAQESFDWVNQPLQFTEELSAYLWSTSQMDAFRQAATTYGHRMNAELAPKPPSIRRLGIAIIGQGASSPDFPLFQNLRPHGTYFTQVNPNDGLKQILSAVEDRARSHPAPYGHWYVDGGLATSPAQSVTCVSYGSLEPVRDDLLNRIQREVSKPGMGPEELRNFLAGLSPRQLNMHGDEVLDRFQLKLLTEGSGTQIFSTTFVQWTARELLRRAEALSLVTRFTPRQRQRPMNEMLSSSKTTVELDPAGSLVDANMAAYYQWINQQRLPGADQSSFVVWFEGHSQAIAIGPTLPHGVESQSPLSVDALLSVATG